MALPTELPRPWGRDQRGFTLVDAVVLFAVVLLLAAIAVPLFESYVADGRRARAGDDVQAVGKAVMAFVEHVGVFPARNAAGVDHSCHALITGPSLPATSPWTADHAWITWGLSTSHGDLLNHHLIANTPQGTGSAAYRSTGAKRWCGPYLPSSSPLDPWGRPYVINVIAAFYTNPTDHKRLWVISAGPNGMFETNAHATATTDVIGDDIGVLLMQRQ